MFENYDTTWYDYDRLIDETTVFRQMVGLRQHMSRLDMHDNQTQKYDQMTAGRRFGKTEAYLRERRECDELRWLKAKLDKYDNQAQKTEEIPVGNNDQYIIDQAVIEAIAKPIRDAEIANRVGAVQTLAPVLEDAPPGTVIRFTRTYNKKIYTYASIKVVRDEGEEPSWYVTGPVAILGDAHSTETLLRWMTTGDTVVSNVQVAAEFTDVTWTPVTAETTASL